MELSAKAFAKLNLYLDVIAKREDGFHDIDSVMQSVSLYDEIRISEKTGEGVVINYQDPKFNREDDIILKACELFFDYSGWRSGLNISIIKNIPTVAGLGGFSADVAAVLRMLNVISGKNYPTKLMLRLCEKLGSDVPFCYDGGAARAGSVGDVLYKLDTVKLFFVFLKEYEKQSTGEMYAKLDSFAIPPSDKINDMMFAVNLRDASLMAKSVYNVFENCWSFDKMTADFKRFNPDNTLLCGSGPTVAAVFTSRDRATECYNSLKKEKQFVFFAESVDTGSVIE